MLTLKEKLIEQCMRNGMMKSAALATVEAATPEINASGGGNHHIQWDWPWDGYPTELVAVWMTIVKRHGLEWIDANLPQAFYRPMFEA